VLPWGGLRGRDGSWLEALHGTRGLAGAVVPRLGCDYIAAHLFDGGQVVLVEAVQGWQGAIPRWGNILSPFRGFSQDAGRGKGPILYF